ncbi:MAG: peptidyl-prolyl cis-trans isomerase [Gemmatimonadetes bacterium]|nr:peptidyl-prolyl cis-trans isomerase [Gemmatimonadota bacterium]
MRYSLVSTFALLVLGSASLCAEETVLRIGDKSISVEEFEKTAQKLRETGYSHVEELDQQGKQELLDGVIARELLIAEALRRGYDRDSAIAQAVAKSERRALMNKLYEQEAVQASYSFSDADLRAFFAQQQYDVEVLSQHIVCATEEEAGLVLELLEEGVPFESLIRPYSLQNIQQRFGPGGWVGWFKIGEVYEGLKVPLSTMSIGSVYPDPVKTVSGYHVFRLGERRPVDFAAVREWVKKKALVQSRADDMERYVGTLRERYQLVLDAEVFAALLSLPPQSTQWDGGDEPLLTWRGGQLIAQEYLALVEQGRAPHPAELDSARLYKAVDNLAGKQIMVAEARKLGIVDDADIRASVEKERDALLIKRLYQAEAERVGEIDDAAVRAFYDQHLDQFTRTDGQVVDFAFVRESIRAALRQRAETEAMDALLAELREAYAGQIQVFPAALEKAFE